MQKITPFLWFDGKAEEAIKLYTSVFKNSKIINITYWGEGSPFPKGQIMNGVFELDGQNFMLLMRVRSSSLQKRLLFMLTAKHRKK